MSACADAELQLGTPPLTRVVSVGWCAVAWHATEGGTDASESARRLFASAGRWSFKARTFLRVRPAGCACVASCLLTAACGTRGIGLEFVKQLLLSKGCSVVATVRGSPPPKDIAGLQARCPSAPRFPFSLEFLAGTRSRGVAHWKPCALACGGFLLHAREHARGSGGKDDRRDEQAHEWAWV